MVLAYTKSRSVLIALLAATAALTVLILVLHVSSFPGEREILAAIVASFGFFISISVSRLIMNSEILSLRYMLTNAMNLERCAAELEKASKRMRKRSEDRFQTAVQAADALSMLGHPDQAIRLLMQAASDNSTPEHVTQFLISALRYSIVNGDMAAAAQYRDKAATALGGLKKGIGKGIYEKEFKVFESYLEGEETMMAHRFHTADTVFTKLEAAMVLSQSDDGKLKSECLEFISKPRDIQ